MQIVHHSPEDLFTDALKEYADEKLARPFVRHHLETDSARLDVDASSYREAIALRVRLAMPGLTITVSALHPDAYGAVDVVADKLARKLRDVEERRRDQQRRRAVELPMMAPLDDEATDIFTADEEEVLREMGALDAVLNA